MRNYTLRIVKKSSLFSLLIITLWVLPIGVSCNFKNYDQLEEIQPQKGPVVTGPEAVEEEIATGDSWVCVMCTQENEQDSIRCLQCNVARPEENLAQPLGDKKEEEQPKQKDSASSLEEEEALNQVDPNKDQCPVCLEWFTKEEQENCKYWVCDHFVCAQCYGKIKNAKKLHDYCPTCRCENLRPQLEKEPPQAK